MKNLKITPNKSTYRYDKSMTSFYVSYYLDGEFSSGFLTNDYKLVNEDSDYSIGIKSNILTSPYDSSFNKCILKIS